MPGQRDKVLEELRARGDRGVLMGELRRIGVTGVYAHMDSLRHEGFGITQKPDSGLDGRGDSRFILTEAPTPGTSEKAQAAPSEERPVQELHATAPARPETCGEATP